jgi:hypothetical protein
VSHGNYLLSVVKKNARKAGVMKKSVGNRYIAVELNFYVKINFYGIKVIKSSTFLKKSHLFPVAVVAVTECVGKPIPLLPLQFRHFLPPSTGGYKLV